MGVALNSATVAVFTPTYNRAYKLPDLYASLLRQTSKDFVWLVVNDGSSDNTRQLVQSYIDEGKISIRYVYRENGGKQRAHNTALEHCNEELFFTVDSDDYLVDTAIEQVTCAWNEWRQKPDVAGIVALKGKSSSEPLNGRFPEGIQTTKVYDLYNKHQFTGDAEMIYRTSILKKYPYEVAEGEKFIAESYAYLQIDDNYDLAVLDSVVMVCEYLPDGYTQSARKVAQENPRGYMKVKKLYMERATSVPDKFESCALYLVGAYYAHEFWGAMREIGNPFLALASGFAAIVLAKTEFSN